MDVDVDDDVQILQPNEGQTERIISIYVKNGNERKEIKVHVPNEVYKKEIVKVLIKKFGLELEKNLVVRFFHKKNSKFDFIIEFCKNDEKFSQSESDYSHKNHCQNLSYHNHTQTVDNKLSKRISEDTNQNNYSVENHEKKAIAELLDEFEKQPYTKNNYSQSIIDSPQDSTAMETLDLIDSSESEHSEDIDDITKKNKKPQALAVFPFPPTNGAISINLMDFKCLASGQFLNDIIIDFYLLYINEELNEKNRCRTHIFSSHFYTRLVKPLSESTNSLGNDEIAKRRHKGVQRWTKNINIFEKDFVIIPVNEHSHWYLAIICFPGLLNKVDSKTSGYIQEGVEYQRPCLLFLDSLYSSKKRKTATLLKDYLLQEHKSKIGEEVDFYLPVEYVKVPTQSNATDCGLYLLQYVEKFFSHPILDYRTPFKNLSTWFPRNTITKKRREIANLITCLAVEYHDSKIDLPDLTFSDDESNEKSHSQLRKEDSFDSLTIFRDSNTNKNNIAKNMIESNRSSLSRKCKENISCRLKVFSDSEDDDDAKSTVKSSRAVARQVPKKTEKNVYLTPRYNPLDIETKVINPYRYDQSSSTNSKKTYAKPVTRGQMMTNLACAGTEKIGKKKIRKLFNLSQDSFTDNSLATQNEVYADVFGPRISPSIGLLKFKKIQKELSAQD